MEEIATPGRSAAVIAPSVVTSFTSYGGLYSVAATSAGNAWAAGFAQSSTGTQTTLLLHWNGTRWSRVTNPQPVVGALNGVTAVSASDAWAVGWTSTDDKALVMHWNGTRWSVQASAARFTGQLVAVAARGNSVWAVGVDASARLSVPLILREVGNRWYVVPSETPTPSFLYGVAVTGAGTAWAEGVISSDGISNGNLLLRWNGTLWKSVSFPLQGFNDDFLIGMAADPAGAVWAVGTDWNSTATAATATSMLWNGTTWRKVPVGPFAWPIAVLVGVTFVPSGTAWAVGYNSAGSLLVRWTGHAWTSVANPEDRSDSGLYGVAATSASSAWAVGELFPAGREKTLILHWNGKTWS